MMFCLLMGIRSVYDKQYHILVLGAHDNYSLSTKCCIYTLRTPFYVGIVDA